jgi:flagellar hook-length control protein FliK
MTLPSMGAPPPAAASSPSGPAPPGGPPGAPPGGPPFDSALANEWARTATAEGQQQSRFERTEGTGSFTRGKDRARERSATAAAGLPPAITASDVSTTLRAGAPSSPGSYAPCPPASTTGQSSATGAATASLGAAATGSTAAAAAAIASSALLPGSPSSTAAAVAPSTTIVLRGEATGVAAGASPGGPSTAASGGASPATVDGSPQAAPVAPPAQSGPQTKPVAAALDFPQPSPVVVAPGQSAAPVDGPGAGTAGGNASSAAAVSTPTVTTALAATTASAGAALSAAGSSGNSPSGHVQAQATATADGSNVQKPPAGNGQTHAGGHDGAQSGRGGAGWSLAASTSSLPVSSQAGPQAGLEAAGATAPSAQAALASSEAESAPLLASGVDLQGVIDAIRATVEIAARAGITQARIALQPQSLGDIRIHLSQTSDGLLARVMAGTPAAAQALAAGHTELRHSLSSLGLSLLRLDIGSFGSTEARAQGREDRLAGGSAEGNATTVSRSPGAEDADAPPEADLTQPPSPLAAAGLVNVLA